MDGINDTVSSSTVNLSSQTPDQVLYDSNVFKRRRSTMQRTLRFVLLFSVLPFAMQEELGLGNCICAVFNSQTSKPIIEQALLYNVTCNAEGEERCQQLCVALGRHTQEDAAQLICEKLGTHEENLEVAVYAKVCNLNNWKFTGLKASAPMCCHAGKSVTCEASTTVTQS